MGSQREIAVDNNEEKLSTAGNLTFYSDCSTGFKYAIKGISWRTL